MGADEAVDGHGDDLVQRAHAFAPSGFDAAVVLVGGDEVQSTLSLVRQGGVIAFPNGVMPEPKAPDGAGLFHCHQEITESLKSSFMKVKKFKNVKRDNPMYRFSFLTMKQPCRRLLDAIAQIRKSGEVAPAYHWLSLQSETKNDVIYEYIKLNVKKPGDRKVKARSLGKLGSEQHREWQSAITRREAIVELEQQIKLVENLMERQKERALIGQSCPSIKI